MPYIRHVTVNKISQQVSNAPLFRVSVLVLAMD
jgi:hypothetical protein